MQSARIHRHGDPSVIRVEDVPVPEPGPGEVLIRVEATSFNPTETALRSGFLAELFPVELPYALGWDVAGTVEGDPVIGWLDGGAAAEFAVAPAERLIPAPTTIPLAEAAALPLAGLTAWQAVEDITAGERVLINGAGGGIGGFAVQLAKHMGAHVIATASARSADAVRGHGADEIIDYTTTPLDAAGEVDAVINLVPVASETLVPLLGKAGRIISATTPVPVRGRHVVARNDPARLAELVRLVDKGILVVGVTGTRPLADLAEVHRASEAGRVHGKVIIKPASRR
ncbi:NADP-dependent oxidoreductase [Allokutzneria sp. A3M-2-11 16]|uniref:NADP-dependent oxidoreductase n=1 Tax=Allokutzneria sp. A3M-2-11 16 TaxID=2962043 RepID=UPI0020B719EB|nr:NADP-dependent oxidoreductase [Allokutzneria sp. A3M-2-11 16]MCP3803213.1 NADP-dependent oxidoreductase [Allokutzneria sp. A3M-2-11 16]